MLYVLRLASPSPRPYAASLPPLTRMCAHSVSTPPIRIPQLDAVNVVFAIDLTITLLKCQDSVCNRVSLMSATLCVLASSLVAHTPRWSRRC